MHAAGESSPGNLSSGTFAICLAVDDEQHLLQVEQDLIAYGIPHVAIREPDAPYNGALMAIGLAPCERKTARRVTSRLALLK